MKKSYIWSFPTRVFHWLFVFFILLAFISSEEDRWLNYHAIIGYSILILLIFRVIWGLIGPKYSLFKDFPIGLDNSKEFLFNIFKKQEKYIGHNPIASYVIFSMFIICFIVIITGIFTYGIQEGKGILSFLNSSFFKEMELFEEIHELFSTLFIILIGSHILGVFTEWFLHKKNETLNSIFTGCKVTNKEESIKLNSYQKTFSFLMLVLFLSFLIFSFIKPDNILLASKHPPTDYKKKNELFVNECVSCHILYPPQLLPKKSWQLVMSDLENHFGDDASIDTVDNKNILNFLETNSAESSTQESSVKMLDSIKNKDIIAITKSSFWENTHKEIPKEVFTHKRIKSKANCKACHRDIEKGLIEDENIKNLTAFM